MRTYIFIPFLILFFTACSIKDKQHVRLDLKITPNNKATLEGKIIKNTNSTKDIYLVLYKHIKGNKSDFKNYKLIDFSTHTTSNNSYKFNITQGIYFLYACQNLEVLRDEKYAYEYFSDYIYVNKSEQKQLNFKLNSTATKTTNDNDLISSNKEDPIFDKFDTILQTTITDKVFNRENSSLGLWSPKQFLQKVGGGIYLLDKYNKNKKVVLFVHGMKGTPIDFRSIINKLDKEKFLPIVYFYPTGINLNYAVDGLKYSIDKLKEKYNIKELIVVSHSMGGLVSRAFINNYKKVTIEKFISISTPWNGQKYAQLGGNMAKKIAPSFGNMVPKSAFIENNQDINFSPNLKHYLLFGYKGKKSLILDNSNDGIISLSSQLYNKAQKKAFLVYGFNESHTSILKSKESIQFINDILNNKL
jgi:uncharacterized alpha/beta hydrolase family protein